MEPAAGRMNKPLCVAWRILFQKVSTKFLLEVEWEAYVW